MHVYFTRDLIIMPASALHGPLIQNLKNKEAEMIFIHTAYTYEKQFKT